MTKTEMENLEYGEKITGPDGVNYVVHNLQPSKGIIIVARTMVVSYNQYYHWTKINNLKNTLVPGTYEVIISKKLG